MVTLLVVGLAAAGPMMDKILPSRVPRTTTQYPKPSKSIKMPKLSYPKGAGTYFYTTPPSGYTEEPEYYTTEKQYSTTPLYPKKNFYYATPLYYKSTTPAPTYKPTTQSSYESTPSYSKVPKYYAATTAAPKYNYLPSTEASYYQAAYQQQASEAPIYKPTQVSYEMPPKYPVPAEASYMAAYTTTPAPMVYHDQAAYAIEAPIYYVLEEVPQYSVQEAYPAEQSEYYPPEQQEYAPEMQSNVNTQPYYTDSQKYPNEEPEYYSAPGYYTTPAAPAYFSSPANEYYPSTTPSYGKQPY